MVERVSAAPPLAEGIARAFPGIGPVAPLRSLGSGFRSEVVETAGGIAVKVGQIPDAVADYAREWRALPVLAGRLTVPIPRPRWHAPPGAAFPHGALAYPALAGAAPPASGSATLARTLGEFLAELHALPESVAHAAGLEPWDPHARDRWSCRYSRSTIGSRVRAVRILVGGLRARPADGGGRPCHLPPRSLARQPPRR